VQLEQSFTLPFPLVAVWPAFADVPMLVACMPGAALRGEPRNVESGADIDLMFTVKLGPITGAFQGQGEVRRDAATQSGIFSGSGADRKSGSRVKGEAKFALTETGASETRVDLKVDYSLTGVLAQFSRGAIVKELAAALTRDFSANLRERIAASQTISGATTDEAPSVQREPAPVSAAIAAPTTAPEEAQSLNAGRLFWRLLRARIGGWFNRTPL
jgi:carbon monoxide dehydrogenase subunit G